MPSRRLAAAAMLPHRLAVTGAALLLAAAWAAASPADAAAQQTPEVLHRQAEQMLGRQLSDQDVLQLLRQSGLTPQQNRDRLEAQGFDRGAADPWLAALAGRASRVPEGTSAAPVLGVMAGTDAGRRAGLDTTRFGRVAPDTLAARAREPDRGPPVFGREVFRRATSQFQPVTTGPVPPDYRLGPGDQLVLVLTDAVEQAYELTVSREGWAVIPESAG